jgi:hypothetical protein
MPLYLYSNPETGETKEIVQSMKEDHVYFEDGIQWKRVFTVPTASIDTKIDPFSQRQFVEKTGNKKGTVGNMMDLSAELSQKREQSNGKEDPVKRKHFSDYEKKVGKKHVADKPKMIETSKVRVDF